MSDHIYIRMKTNHFCLKLFAQLNNEDISYGVLRNFFSLPYTTAGSDLDIWISHHDVGRFNIIIERVAKQTSFHLVSYLEDKFCPKYCFLNVKEGFQMDVFIGDIPFQNSPMVPEKDLLKHIVYYNGIKVVDEDFGNLLAYIKEIISNRRCNIKYTSPLMKNKDRFSKTYLEENLSLFSDDFVYLLSDSLKNDKLEGNAHYLSLTGRKTIIKQSQLIYRIKKLQRIINAPGYILAIEGTDGSGKSTIIDAITPILNEAFHNGVIYNHLRPNAIPDLGVLLGKKEKQISGTVNTDPHALKQSGVLGSLVRWGYYMIDYTFGYMKTVWPLIHTKSKVFIFDRYYYDYYIDQKRSRTTLPRWVIRLGECLVPKPDLILCLGGTPQKIFERKPETSLEEVKRQTEALRAFCQKRKNAVWVDTTTSIAESTNKTMTAIVEMMSERFKNVELHEGID